MNQEVLSKLLEFNKSIKHHDPNEISWAYLISLVTLYKVSGVEDWKSLLKSNVDQAIGIVEGSLKMPS